MRGKFITLEGMDGAGKSSHIAAILETLQDKGVEVVARVSLAAPAWVSGYVNCFCMKPCMLKPKPC